MAILALAKAVTIESEIDAVPIWAVQVQPAFAHQSVFSLSQYCIHFTTFSVRLPVIRSMNRGM